MRVPSGVAGWRACHGFACMPQVSASMGYEACPGKGGGCHGRLRVCDAGVHAGMGADDGACHAHTNDACPHHCVGRLIEEEARWTRPAALAASVAASAASSLALLCCGVLSNRHGGCVGDQGEHAAFVRVVIKWPWHLVC